MKDNMQSDVTARINVELGSAKQEVVWVRAKGDLMGSGGDLALRMAKEIKATWLTCRKSSLETNHGFPNFLWVYDVGRVTLSWHPPEGKDLTGVLAVLPAYLIDRATAAFLALVGPQPVVNA